MRPVGASRHGGRIMARTLNIALGTAMTVALMVTALWARLFPDLRRADRLE